MASATIPTQAQQAVLGALASFPDGATARQIEPRLAKPSNLRTLQRWINDLTAQARVHRQGQGRSSGRVRVIPLCVNRSVNLILFGCSTAKKLPRSLPMLSKKE